MGSNELGRARGPAPSHPVTLSTFYIHRHEVTNGEYQLCVEAGACIPPHSSSSSTRIDYYGLPEYDQFPVVAITQLQAQSYCTWIEGSLPTEQQWEKAARSTDGRRYPWGDEPPLSADANLAFDSGPHDTHRVGTHSHDRSPHAVFDMAGNVSEWTMSWYISYEGNLQPFDYEGTLVVIRGGDFLSDPVSTSYGRTYFRSSDSPEGWGFSTGFRCVWSPEH